MDTGHNTDMDMSTPAILWKNELIEYKRVGVGPIPRGVRASEYVSIYLRGVCASECVSIYLNNVTLVQLKI
jgi:hypothetical protein